MRVGAWPGDLGQVAAAGSRFHRKSGKVVERWLPVVALYSAGGYCFAEVKYTPCVAGTCAHSRATALLCATGHLLERLSYAGGLCYPRVYNQ